MVVGRAASWLLLNCCVASLHMGTNKKGQIVKIERIASCLQICEKSVYSGDNQRVNVLVHVLIEWKVPPKSFDSNLIFPLVQSNNFVDQKRCCYDFNRFFQMLQIYAKFPQALTA